MDEKLTFYWILTYWQALIRKLLDRDVQNNISFVIIFSLRGKWDFEMRISFQNLISEVRKKILISKSHFIRSEMRFSVHNSHFDELRWDSHLKILISLKWDEKYFLGFQIPKQGGIPMSAHIYDFQGGIHLLRRGK